MSITSGVRPAGAASVVCRRAPGAGVRMNERRLPGAMWLFKVKKSCGMGATRLNSSENRDMLGRCWKPLFLLIGGLAIPPVWAMIRNTGSCPAGGEPGGPASGGITSPGPFLIA